MANIYGTNGKDTILPNYISPGVSGGKTTYGPDYINGLAGADTMGGGYGDDTYYIDTLSDKVIEYANQGYDTVFSSVSTSYKWLPANVEKLELWWNAYYGDGNDLDNVVSGSANANALSGHGGHDIIYGLGGNDYLYGGSGNDLLNNGAGVDTSYGGTGDDTYYIDTLSDKVIEYANQGYDTVFSSVSTSYKWLPANVEKLELWWNAYYGDGNDLDNVVSGSANANALSGHGGHDIIYGLGGNDYLYGGSGNDLLNNGAGVDTSYGGTGDDIYYIDTLSDKVIEYANQGNDAVVSSVSTSYKWLPNNVESLALTGTAYYGDGNDLNNFITGNGSANSLYGYGGSDHLYGEGGNDYLYGGDGPDSLSGGTGVDTIYGGAGNDDFVFTDLSGATIKDFSFTDGDEFFLYGLPGKPFEQGLVWTGDGLNPAWYFEGSSTGNGAFNLSGIYLQTVDANTGNLWYNPTSNIAGDSTMFATVDVVGTNVTNLSAADFALA